MSKKAPKLVDWPHAFSKAKQALRKAKGWSQEKFGFEVGLDRTYISGIERGVRNPSLKNIVRIAQALGVTPAKLLHDAEDHVLVSRGGRMKLGRAGSQGRVDKPRTGSTGCHRH